MSLPRKQESKFTRGLCVVCNVRQQAFAGGGRYRATCWKCHVARYPAMNETLRRRVRRTGRVGYEHKGGACERCGFVAEHPCQLDIHHRDGNKRNGAPENIETLCANCHRLVTFQEGHWEQGKSHARNKGG